MIRTDKKPGKFEQDTHLSSESSVRGMYSLEALQNLSAEEVLRCQSLLGHGAIFGIWETPKSLVSHLKKNMRSVDLRKRVCAEIPKYVLESDRAKTLIDDGILWMLRLALVLRLGPASLSKRNKYQPLDATTVTQHLHGAISAMVGRGIVRRFDDPLRDDCGFVNYLHDEDISTLEKKKASRNTLKRLIALKERGLWNDVPRMVDFRGRVTDPRGKVGQRIEEKTSEPYLPISDEYMAEIGPRILWLIKDFGPNLIQLLNSLTESCPYFSDPWQINNNKRFEKSLENYFKKNVWIDRNGQCLGKPPFPLKHRSRKFTENPDDPIKGNAYEWPPKSWDSLKTLSVCLQSAHLWITLLATSGRAGEVMTLPRKCIEWASDGLPYANGKTFKLSSRILGTEREWPAPEILVDVLAQQVQLIEASQRVARAMSVGKGDDLPPIEESEHLWGSLGYGLRTAEDELAACSEALQMLAERLGMSPKPDGRNVHPHRFRKTIARLVALAVVGSPRILMRLLGHKDINMTLGYMLTDPGLSKDIDVVAREMRVMLAKDLVEDMHAAHQAPESSLFGGYGGDGAVALSAAVSAHESELYRTGEKWGVDSAYELAVILTNNGQSMRLVSEHIICTKADGETGMCNASRGAPDTGNCQSKCGNRIESKTARREVKRIVPILITNAQKAIANNDLLVAASFSQQLTDELARFEDIKAEWVGRVDVMEILEATQ